MTIGQVLAGIAIFVAASWGLGAVAYLVGIATLPDRRAQFRRTLCERRILLCSACRYVKHDRIDWEESEL